MSKLAVAAALCASVAAGSGFAQTASGLSGTPVPNNAPISGATMAPVPPVGAAPAAGMAAVGGQKPTPKNVYKELPSNARLDASSKKIDRQIKRGICVGC